MTVADEIKAKLAAAFDATTLTVIDESDQHIGHAGRPEGGQSHFRVQMAAPEMADLSRLARHRAIHAAIGADLVDRIHALAIEVSG
ncbi:UNVERIFIED_CONTAM: hypothetical protein GTU68_022117 [Idotea baltica]|nr:hypothetical protein [Idotea baltica]